jgi:Protein of unknown function (DUF3311)
VDRSGSKRGWYWLLALPLVLLLIPQIYNSEDPELGGIPFFYWYQLAWVPLSVVITWFVYRKTKEQR